MPKTRILIVDDDQWLLESLAGWLGEQGWEPFVARTIPTARKAIETTPIDVCLIDVCLDREDGFELLSWVRRRGPSIPVVMMTGYGGPDAAIDCTGRYNSSGSPTKTRD